MCRVISLAAVLVIAGCATQSADIAATYVSPVQYASYDCSQLVAEGQRLIARTAQLGGRLDQASSNDKALVAGGILFFPVLFALGGTKQQEAEYARLKGEYEAVQQAAVIKKCAIAPGGSQSAHNPTEPAFKPTAMEAAK
jgi:hypothetical protein